MSATILDLTLSIPRNPRVPFLTRDLKGLTSIAIHHTAGPADQTPEAIANYHISKGWSGIGYHYLVYLQGVIYKVRPLSAVPACVLGFNARSICIAFVGDFTSVSPSDVSLAAAKLLCHDLRVVYPWLVEVKGHREFPNQETACPGASFPIEEFRASVGFLS